MEDKKFIAYLYGAEIKCIYNYDGIFKIKYKGHIKVDGLGLSTKLLDAGFKNVREVYDASTCSGVVTFEAKLDRDKFVNYPESVKESVLNEGKERTVNIRILEDGYFDFIDLSGFEEELRYEVNNYCFREILDAEVKFDKLGRVYKVRVLIAYQSLLETLDELGLWYALDDQHTIFEFHGCIDSIQDISLPIEVKTCINDGAWHKLDNIEVRITRDNRVLSGYYVSFIIQKYSNPVLCFKNGKGLEFVNRLYISTATCFDRRLAVGEKFEAIPFKGIKDLTPLHLKAEDLDYTVDRWMRNDAVDAVGYALDYCRRDVDICKEALETHNKMEETKMKRKSLVIKKIIVNDPATIILWGDGDKTVVKCQDGDTFDAEKGIAMCVMKRCIGTNATDSNYLDIIRKKLDPHADLF